MLNLVLVPLLLCIATVNAEPYTGTFPLPLTSKDILISFPKKIWGGYPSTTKWGIDAYSWSVETPMPIAGQVTKSQPSQLSIIRTQDEISPLFFQTQVKGSMIGPIYIYTATKTLKFENCYFTNSIDQNAANEVVKERITISFMKITYDAKRYDIATGKEIGIFSGGYDFTTGQVF